MEMASGGQQPAEPDLAGPATRVVVALGRPAHGPGACRVESPERVMRIWEMLIEAGDELKPETLPPETLARVQRLLKAASAELQRSVSPALARELRQLIDCGGAEPSASEVRIEYASFLGWLGGLVVGMYSQLQDARDGLRMAGQLPDATPGERDPRSAPGTAPQAAGSPGSGSRARSVRG